MPQIVGLLSEAPVIEILDGVAYRKMSPRSAHARVQALLVAIVDRCGRSIGMAGTEWDFRVGVVDDSKTFLVPDVAFLRYDRLKAIACEEREQPPVAPDIAIEVRSKPDRPAFRKAKIAKYLSCGTLLVLDADPASRTIEAHAAHGVQSYGREDRFTNDAVPWLVFDVAEAFVGLEYLEK